MRVPELGGRWKPLHYAAARFFAPLALLLVELEDGRVAAYGHCDRAADAPTAGNLTITVQSWDQLQPRLQIQVPLPAQYVLILFPKNTRNSFYLGASVCLQDKDPFGYLIVFLETGRWNPLWITQRII